MNASVWLLAILSLSPFDLLSAPQRHASPDRPGSSEAYLELLRKSTKDTFQRFVSDYDRYIRLHPSDIVVRIEECKFIEDAVDDDLVSGDVDGQIGPRAAMIRSDFSSDPRAAVYVSTRMNSDSALAYLESFVKQHKDSLRCAVSWQLWDRLSELYAEADKPYNSIHYAVDAMRCNDTLDITTLVAEQAEKVGDTKTALAYIGQFERRDATSWILRRKADLLLRNSQFERAAAMYLRILKGGASSSTYYEIGQALFGCGRYNEARDAFMTSGKTSYYAESSARSVFEIDLRTASLDSAVNSYNVMRDFGFRTDPLGKYRLALFLHHPFAPWLWRDFLNLGALGLCLLVLALLPFIIIVPIHYAGLLRNVPQESLGRWNLRHVWFVGELLVGGTFLAWFFYYYASMITLFGNRMIEPASVSSADHAWADMVYLVTITVGSLALVRLGDLKALWGSRWSKKRSIFSGLGTMLGVRVVAVIILVALAAVFHLKGMEPDYFKPLAVEVSEDLRAIRAVFGWPVLILIVGVVAPMCEEMLFRGVLLRSFQRHVPFFWANLFQALGFAFLHTGVALMVFALVMGFGAGLLRNRANSLMPGIIMHVSNNFISMCAFLVLG